MPKENGKAPAQVSIEILILAGVIILLSITVFSYYTRIGETTFAMELSKIEALKWIDEEQGGSHTIKEVKYSLKASEIDVCIFTLPESPQLFSSPDYYVPGYLSTKLAALKTKLTDEYALFNGLDVYVYHNPPDKCA